MKLQLEMSAKKYRTPLFFSGFRVVLLVVIGGFFPIKSTVGVFLVN